MELGYHPCGLACSDGHPCGAAVPLDQPPHRTAKGREVHICGRCMAAVKKGRPRNRGYKIERNDPCPCGSDKKYKRCCRTKMAAFQRRHPVPGTGKNRPHLAGPSLDSDTPAL